MEKTFNELLKECYSAIDWDGGMELNEELVLMAFRKVREATIEECTVKRDFLIKYINEAVDEMETLGADNIADNIINNLPNYKTDRIKVKDE